DERPNRANVRRLVPRTTDPPPSSTLFPYTTLFRSVAVERSGSPPPHRKSATAHAFSGQQAGQRRKRRRVAALQSALPTADWPLKIGRDTSELQSLAYLVCRLLLEKKNAIYTWPSPT